MPRPQTRAERKEATRARLLKVARRIFVRHGFDGASIALVCREARVTHGALYHHFSSKEALFAGAILQVFTEVGERVSAAVHAHRGWQQVQAACAAYLDACTDPEVQTFLFKDGPRVLSRGEFDAIDHGVNAPLVDGLIATWMAQGVLAPQPVSFLSRTLGAAFAEAGLLIREAQNPRHARVETEALLMSWVSALRRSPETDPRPRLSTERLVLTPWQSSDADELEQLLKAAETDRRCFDAAAKDAAWVANMTEQSERAFARARVGLWLARCDDHVVGFVGFVAHDAVKAQLHVATAPDVRRRGYALEMAAAALREACARRCRVVATVDEQQSAGANLLLRLGFVQLGRRPGEFGPILEYALPFHELEA